MNRRIPRFTRSAVWLLLIVSMLAQVAAHAQQGDPIADLTRLIEVGKQALMRRDYPTADQAFAAGYQRAQALGDPKTLGAVLNNVGAAYTSAGQYSKALDWLGRAIQVKRGLGDAAGVAGTLLNVGGVYYSQGEFDKAQGSFKQALDIAQPLGDVRIASGALNNLGLISAALGQNQKALDYYLRSLSMKDERTDPQGVNDTLFNVAQVYMRTGQLDDALKYFTRLLAVDQATGDIRKAANTLDSIGQIYGRKQQFDRALQYGQQALALEERAGSPPREVAATLNGLGIACMRLGQKEKAAAYLSRSVELKRTTGNRRDLAASLSNLALLYFDLGQYDKAQPAFAAAIENNEAIAEQITDATQVGEFQQDVGKFYTRYATLLVLQHKPEAALEILERGRGQGLARQAGQNRTDYARWLPAGDAARYRAANTEYLQAAAQWKSVSDQESDLDGPGTSPVKQRLLAMRSRFNAAEQNLTQLRKELRMRSPVFAWLQGAQRPTAAELLGLAAQNPDTLYLEWGIGQENMSILLTVSKKAGVKGFTLPVGEKVLRDQVNAWRNLLTDSDSDAGAERAKAQALYGTLLGEAEKAGLVAPETYPHIVLVGDGPLLDLPFAALVGGDKRLVERFSLSTTMSMGMLMWPREVARATSSLLCAADPLGAKPSKTGRPMAPAPGALPAARKEGQSVAALFPGGLLLIGEAATKSEVQRRMADASVLHFATHGYLDDENGLDSGLVLSHERGSTEELTLLPARDIVGMHLNAQLAVLSACETGKGKASGGEGLLGLTWAFRAAGCPSIVASQWSVDDAATGKLMVQFYTSLKAGKRKDEAMREAMLAVQGEAGTRHPMFWAAFQVFGESTPLHP